MSDYPDYTTLMQIIGSDIMVPIDVQGAYIMMPVDIQAQYVTLDIDIVAQTVGNIGIDIKAQTVGNVAVNIAAAVTLNVDITTQSIENLTIDIEAQSVGVYLQPEWTALQGTDENLIGSVELASGARTLVIDYTVTADKTFYICQWGGIIDGDFGVNGDISDYYDAAHHLRLHNGGRMGFAIALVKPVAIPGGHHIVGEMYQISDAAQQGRMSIGGYEV